MDARLRLVEEGSEATFESREPVPELILDKVVPRRWSVLRKLFSLCALESLSCADSFAGFGVCWILPFSRSFGSTSRPSFWLFSPGNSGFTMLSSNSLLVGTIPGRITRGNGFARDQTGLAFAGCSYAGLRSA